VRTKILPGRRALAAYEHWIDHDDADLATLLDAGMEQLEGTFARTT
jgi:hypothetical protein